MNNLYKQITNENPEKSNVLYECDGLACSKPCSEECYHTSDITHAKNFNYEDGLWIESRDRHTKPIWEMTDEEKEKLRKSFTGTISFTAIPDPVNHPNHYEMVGPFESFDIIVESLGIEGARYFCQGNIIKYQTRYRDKNGEEDLKKRHWYSRMDQMLAKCKTIEDYYKLKESDF